MNELNRKLAEWAGLRFYPECECIRCKGICWGESEETYGKNRSWHTILPRFTTSLDACFKWLVPKLGAWRMFNGACPTDSDSGYIEGVYVEVEGMEEFAETPALALCKAIEKLIDDD